ncbi:hypothetical protein DDP54_00955 (plasmid) [Cellulomonas sp. WB94]|uniref:hypothetical protein n=1 Tax=Cellulomonas sp. WB94 TaxID=2173174 RepID=UPI000D56CC0A|nr:hypothetical protein [Cellulomonas sp. WB94]PVU84444.1 hypothetical protein DDP54_00955 [Cellulomonas sp. WB94]
MGLISTGHLDLATRFAALALATPAQGDAASVGLLQDDLAVILGEMTQAVTGLPAHPLQIVDVSDLARRPVHVLRLGLATLPRFDPSTPPAVPPSARWDGHPTKPARATDSTAVWKGLVVAAAIATQGIRTQARHLTSAQRWAVLGNVAAVAEVLAVTRSDLLTQTGAAGRSGGKARRAAAALAVEAREVARLAGDPNLAEGRAWMPPRPGRGVVPVGALEAVPAAVVNMGRLLARGDASITDVLAVTRVLAQTSRAAAAALNAAGSSDPAMATTLSEHADVLARAVTSERANLASLVPGSMLVLAQGRELGAAALPRLQAVATRPTQSRAVMPAVLGYAGALAGVTFALQEATAQVTREHGVAVHDRSDDAPYPWRPAHTADLVPFQVSMETATAIARRATAAAHDGAPGMVAERPRHDASVLLRDALIRRQRALRPDTPARAALTAELDPAGRAGQAIGA